MRMSHNNFMVFSLWVTKERKNEISWSWLPMKCITCIKWIQRGCKRKRKIVVTSWSLFSLSFFFFFFHLHRVTWWWRCGIGAVDGICHMELVNIKGKVPYSHSSIVYDVYFHHIWKEHPHNFSQREKKICHFTKRRSILLSSTRETSKTFIMINVLNILT